MDFTPFRIWGRVEKLPRGYRAIVAAFPLSEGVGPSREDIRHSRHANRGSANLALRPLAHTLASTLHDRGGRVMRIDLGS